MLTRVARTALHNGHAGLEVQHFLQDMTGGQAEGDAEEPADEGQRRRLDEELPEDLLTGGAECLAQSDLLGSGR